MDVAPALQFQALSSQPAIFEVFLVLQGGNSEPEGKINRHFYLQLTVLIEPLKRKLISLHLLVCLKPHSEEQPHNGLSLAEETKDVKEMLKTSVSNAAAS